MSMLMTISTSIQEIGPLSESSHYGKCDWEWRLRAIRTHLGLLTRCLPRRPGLGANACLWVPLHLDLIFTCLNLFKSLQSQPSAEIYPSNLIQPQLEIEVAALQPRVPHNRQHNPSQKGKGCVIIDFAACLSHFDRRRVWASAFNGVSLIDLERLQSVQTSQLQQRNAVFTVHRG